MRTVKKRLTFTALIALLAIFLGACGGSSSSAVVAPPAPPPPPPPPPPPVQFNQFVQNEFAATADDTDPQPVDDVDFIFDEDPTAFDSLLQ